MKTIRGIKLKIDSTAQTKLFFVSYWNVRIDKRSIFYTKIVFDHVVWLFG